MEGGGDGRLVSNGALRIDVEPRPDEVAVARHAVVNHLLDHGVPSAVADDLQLVTSELVTNAVVHGQPGPIAVEVEVRDDVVLQVTCRGPVAAIPDVTTWSPAPPLAASGRGLGIVERLCDDVGVKGDETRATVTCRRRLPDGGDR